MHEAGTTDTADPLGGSYYIEALTAELEERARELIERVDELGGAVAAIEAGFVQGEIEEAAYRFQTAVEAGDRIVVGVNEFTEESDERVELHRVDPAGEQRQRERTRARPRRAQRRSRRERARRGARDGGRHRQPAPAAPRGAPRPLHGRRALRRPARALGHLRRAGERASRLLRPFGRGSSSRTAARRASSRSTATCSPSATRSSEYAQPGPLPRPLAAWRAVREPTSSSAGSRRGMPPPRCCSPGSCAARPSSSSAASTPRTCRRSTTASSRAASRRLLARTSMRLAGRLMTNSEYSRDELRRNAGFDARGRLPRRFPTLSPASPRGRASGWRSPSRNVARLSLERKGLRPFVEAAALAARRRVRPRGQVARRRRRPSCAPLAAANVRLTGGLTDEELDGLYERASVYVQASRHEGFGMTVAEAMLAGCIPVVTAAGALPEVVGDAGVVVDVARSERRRRGRDDEALGLPRGRARRARERVLERFPLEVRRRACSPGGRGSGGAASRSRSASLSSTSGRTASSSPAARAASSAAR